MAWMTLGPRLVKSSARLFWGFDFLAVSLPSLLVLPAYPGVTKIIVETLPSSENYWETA